MFHYQSQVGYHQPGVVVIRISAQLDHLLRYKFPFPHFFLKLFFLWKNDFLIGECVTFQNYRFDIKQLAAGIGKRKRNKRMSILLFSLHHSENIQRQSTRHAGISKLSPSDPISLDDTHHWLVSLVVTWCGIPVLVTFYFWGKCRQKTFPGRFKALCNFPCFLPFWFEKKNGSSLTLAKCLCHNK